jgi:ABC-type multidrug transport system fused ATPase/permease subunit
VRTISVFWRLTSVCRGLTVWAVLAAGAAAVSEGLALGMLIPVLDIFTSGGSPQAAAVFTGLGIPDRPQAHLLILLGAFVVLVIAGMAARGAADVLAVHVKTRVERWAREEMTDALLGMDWSHFIRLRQGDIGKAMVIEGMQMGLGAHQLIIALGAGLAVLCYFGVALFISVHLTLLAVGFGAIGAAVYAVGVRGVRRHADAMSGIATDIGDRSAEIFGNLKYYRSTGADGLARARSDALFATYADTYTRSQTYAPVLRASVEAFAGVFVAVFLYYRLGVQGGSLAEAIVFLAVFYRLAPRLLHAQNGLFQARTYLTWYETYEERLRFAVENRFVHTGTRKPEFEREVVLEQIIFRYPGSEIPAVDRVSLTIQKGECVALVGPSGGGKSTIVDLITGLLRPESGQIRIDGVDLAELDVAAWRGKLGIVMQESPMLHATIAENVALGTDGFDRARVEFCLERAHAADFVAQLPQGIDTVIAERGARLSGGQRQRLGIARALYRDPALVILDEATSALDSHSEERIREVIAEMKGDQTVLLIAHRLQTASVADRIVVLCDGRIIESGTWHELVAGDGLFREMWMLQSRGAAAIDDNGGVGPTDLAAALQTRAP